MFILARNLCRTALMISVRLTIDNYFVKLEMALFIVGVLMFQWPCVGCFHEKKLFEGVINISAGWFSISF